MAKMVKRRWYQFSLRALLILMVVTSLPLGAFVAWRQYLIAQRLAEIETAFRWLESLGYPEMPNGRPVLVASTLWSNNRATTTEPRGLGFLLGEDSTSFTVLTPSLERMTIERERTIGDWGLVESAFERISFGTAAVASLERKWDFFYNGMSGEHGDGLSERGQLLVLAWACARHGAGEWAVKLYDAAEAAQNWRDAEIKSLIDRVAADFAHRETRAAIMDCGSDKPRSQLLQKFRWLKEHFPNSKHAGRVREKVAIFEQMVAEDAAHSERRAAGPPFEQLSQQEQIAELIFQLRDRPPSTGCHPIHDPSAPFERLHTYGYDAIPQLAAALGDKSLSRSVVVDFVPDASLEYRVRTIGEIVDSILIGVAGRRFDPNLPIWSHAERIAAIQDAARMEAMQKAALEWHQQLVAKGELACLVEAIGEGGPYCGTLAYKLAANNPEAACAAVLNAAAKGNDDSQALFSNILGSIRTDASLPYLCSQLKHRRIENRLSAAEALKQLGRPEGAAAMIEDWQRSEHLAELKKVGPFLVRSGNPHAIRAVTKRISELSLEQRAAIMYEARSDANLKLDANDDLRTAMIELLLVALGDTEMRGEVGGYWGGPSIVGLRICDMAGYHLNQLEPERFSFDIEAALVQRERERGRILRLVRNR